MKVGRNDPCPCGSGKKYKKCCLPKEEAERLRKIWGETEGGPSLEALAGSDPEAVVRAYVTAFTDQRFGLTYDLHLEESPFRRKRVSKAAYVGEMKTLFNPDHFKVETTEILKSRAEEERAEVLHKVRLAFGEEKQLTVVENYLLRKTPEGWRIFGTQKKEFEDSEEIPEEIDFSDFEGLPIG